MSILCHSSVVCFTLPFSQRSPLLGWLADWTVHLHHSVRPDGLHRSQRTPVLYRKKNLTKDRRSKLHKKKTFLKGVFCVAVLGG